MIVIIPLTIDDTNLVSSSVPEPDASQGEVAWAAGTNWADGSVVIRSTTHRRYVRLAPGGVDAALPENSPTKWQDDGPTNRFAMFARDRNKQTIAASPLVFEVSVPKRIDSVGLLRLQAATARIVQEAGATTVYDQTYGLTRRNTRTATDYCFGGFRQLKSLLRTDLPPYANTTVTVTLTNGAQPVHVSGVTINKSVYMGRVEAGNESDARNFSEAERDAFGGVTLKRQRSVPLGGYTVLVDKFRVDEMQELRDEDLNGVVALWSGLDDKVQHGYFGMSLINGFYTQFKINASFNDFARITLKLEEF